MDVVATTSAVHCNIMQPANLMYISIPQVSPGQVYPLPRGTVVRYGQRPFQQQQFPVNAPINPHQPIRKQKQAPHLLPVWERISECALYPMRYVYALHFKWLLLPVADFGCAWFCLGVASKAHFSDTEEECSSRTPAGRQLSGDVKQIRHCSQRTKVRSDNAAETGRTAPHDPTDPAPRALSQITVSTGGHLMATSMYSSGDSSDLSYIHLYLYFFVSDRSHQTEEGGKFASHWNSSHFSHTMFFDWRYWLYFFITSRRISFRSSWIWEVFTGLVFRASCFWALVSVFKRCFIPLWHPYLLAQLYSRYETNVQPGKKRKTLLSAAHLPSDQVSLSSAERRQVFQASLAITGSLTSFTWTITLSLIWSLVVPIYQRFSNEVCRGQPFAKINESK